MYHWYVLELSEVNTFPLAVIPGTGGLGSKVTAVAAEDALTQPMLSVTLRVINADELTVIETVVSPVDQIFPVAVFDVRTTLPPSQKEVIPPAMIIGVAGAEFTETVVVSEVALQPLLSVTVTV